MKFSRYRLLQAFAGKPKYLFITLHFVFSLHPSLAIQVCSAQGDDSTPTTRLPLRANPEGVQLISTEGGTNSPTETSSDSWRSLTGPASDPMVTPTPSPEPTTTNSLDRSQLSPKSKLITKKDDYGPLTGWGIRTAVGPALQQNIHARTEGGSGNATYYFSPGFRSDFNAFYNLANGFEAGLESGFIYNSISSIDSSSLPNNNLIAGSDDFGNGAFYQVPLLGSIRFQIPNSGKFRGYFTGGAGLVWDYLTISALGETYAQHQWNFVFQMGAGFLYNVLPGLDLETSFKTLITPNPLIFGDGTSQVKASYSYTLEIGFAYRF